MKKPSSSEIPSKPDQPRRQDRFFDGLADKFAHNIYATAKGRLRLRILRDRMRAELPLDQGPLRVLEVGGGMGQISAWLARQGHQVLLTEPSQDMLDLAQPRLARCGVRWLQSPIQTLDTHLAEDAGAYDLLVCHAVLEWLQDPLPTLQNALRYLRPGGYLSLMFFNADALFFANVQRGNFKRVLDGGLQGKGRGRRLTPISPLRPDLVLDWLAAAGYERLGVTGVRVFSDYLKPTRPPEATPERLLQLEKRYCQAEPWWRLGRYCLVHAIKPR